VQNQLENSSSLPILDHYQGNLERPNILTRKPSEPETLSAKKLLEINPFSSKVNLTQATELKGALAIIRNQQLD